MALQNSSIALLSSAANILQQRSATISSATGMLDPDQKSALIYKQTTVFEETLKQLKDIIPKFRDIVGQMTTLGADAVKNAMHAAIDRTPPPRPGTSAATLATAEISEDQTRAYISQIRDMYNSEYVFKITLINQLYQQPKLDYTAINDILILWSSQPHIDFTVEKEMAERLNLYKKVKRVVEAKD